MANAPLTENSRAWVELKVRLASVESKILDSTVVALQTKNAIVGSYDDSGAIWHVGIREKVEMIDRKVDAVDVKVDEANAKADTFKALGYWAIGGIWLLVSGLALEFANNFFGWWGASHAAVTIMRGH